MALLVTIVILALAFDVTNGFHDSSNSIATLVATRAARPGAAIALAAIFHVLGPILLGTAVADTVGGIVDRDATDAVRLVAAALSAALTWNLVTWARGLPSSSSHALVGGLVGAAIADAGTGAVNWSGMDGLRPSGVIGVLVVLAVSPVIGAVAGAVSVRIGRHGLRRARREIATPLRYAQWVSSAALALSHGANDAQKTMGVITLVLLADGRIDTFAVPLWVKLAAAASLTLGTALGGWRIIRTLGRGIFRLRSLDGLASQTGSAATIFGSAMVGAPVSTTHVVASSVVGVGVGQSWRRVRWRARRRDAPRLGSHAPRDCRPGGRILLRLEGARMKRHWFLPEMPDLLAMVRLQADVTLEGLEAFARWSGGDTSQAQLVRDAEHRADDAKRDVRQALRAAFSTPLDAEDLYELSERMDAVLERGQEHRSRGGSDRHLSRRSHGRDGRRDRRRAPPHRRGHRSPRHKH